MKDLAKAAELSESEQARFNRISRLFLAGTCFTRARTNSEDDWRFLIRNQGLFIAFFEVLGWTFELRMDLGAAVVRPTHRRHAHWFSVPQTHLVYHLIHAHFETTTSADLDRADVTVTFGDLIERVKTTVPRGTRVNRDALQGTCRKLKNFGALEFASGFSGHPSDVISVLPVIEMVVPREVIERQIKAVREEAPQAEEPEKGGRDMSTDDARMSEVLDA